MSKETEIEHVEERTVVAYVCDKCGRRATVTGSFEDENGPVEAQEFVHMEIRGGYSSVFGDGQYYELDLCQYCVEELLGEYLRHVGRDLVVYGMAEGTVFDQRIP